MPEGVVLWWLRAIPAYFALECIGKQSQTFLRGSIAASGAVSGRRACSTGPGRVASRGSRRLRRPCADPWHGGAKGQRLRSWSSCVCENRGSWTGDGGWVEMCAWAWNGAPLSPKKICAYGKSLV
jgi:hypothetical protein